MLNLLSGFLYAMCVAWPILAMLLLAGFLACLGEKFPRFGKILIGDYPLEDDDEFFGDDESYGD